MTILSGGPAGLGGAAAHEAFCPLASNAETTCAETAAALSADGAYTADVLRTVRGTPNAEELAALVAALLFTRLPQHRYAAPGTRTARP